MTGSDDPDPTIWPWWVTLGGDAWRSAANSDWLAWTHFAVCLGVFAASAWIGLSWVRDARRAGRRSRRPLLLLAAAFAGGGVSGFGLPAAMAWAPLWGPLLLARAATLVLAVWFAVSRRHLTTEFQSGAAVLAVADRLAVLAAPVGRSAAAAERAELIRCANELRVLVREANR